MEIILHFFSFSLIISRLLQTFQDVAHCNFVLEFLQGGDLLHWLNRRKRFSEQEVKFYACEIFLGVSTIHAEGFLYRDLKLENVVLDVSGHIKIVDFGFCKMPDSNGRCFSMIGTPQYLAQREETRREFTDFFNFFSSFSMCVCVDDTAAAAAGRSIVLLLLLCERSIILNKNSSPLVPLFQRKQQKKRRRQHFEQQ